MSGVDKGKSLGKKKPRGTGSSSLDFQRLKGELRGKNELFLEKWAVSKGSILTCCCLLVFCPVYFLE